MALTPQSNEAFLREVDEELRREEAIKLWKRWGIVIVAVIVAALVALAGWLWWQSHRKNVAGEQGIQFNQAMDALGNQQPDKAAPILADLAKNGTEGYAALAKFTQADIALQKQDLKGAAKLFAEVAADTGAAQPLRDLALVRQTLAEYDTLQPQVVIDRLRPLAVKGNPYYGTAGEMTAVAHLRMNRRDLAGRMFGEIARDENVPASIRQRAVQMAGVLGVDAVDQAEEKKAG
ncbi:tetratricopeptide repeat protein [uncultured Sphingomonas sp.]|uniref:tetratricopeptide repeat protein n=1 Tax=uncultured Sphingomonas sp. TaxID=158754 RepID=UPI0025D489B6|nr:tetratricopeptide repeat protein [uncultured Sphingomonas sp.]